MSLTNSASIAFVAVATSVLLHGAALAAISRTELPIVLTPQRPLEAMVKGQRSLQNHCASSPKPCPAS